MIEINNENEFDNLINENEVVVVKFGAEWCGPCKTLHPIMESISNEMNEVKFAEVDVEDVSELTSRFRIRNVPTTLVIKSGEVVGKIVGSVGENEMKEKIKSYL